MPKSVMITISTNPRNASHAAETSHRFRSAAARDPAERYCFGVEITGDRDMPEIRSMLETVGGQWGRDLYFTDDRTRRHLVDTIASAGLPQPFSTGFSFGSAVSLKHVLALHAGCDFRLAVDPGTAPPAGQALSESMAPALDELSRRPELVLAAGGYKGRLPFRTEHLHPNPGAAFDTLKEFLGVHPLEQIAAGAALWRLTEPAYGIPGVPTEPYLDEETKRIEPTLVFGLDDLFYQAKFPDQVQWIQKLQFERFTPVGQPRAALEHYRTVVGQVFWRALESSNGSRSAANAAVVEFLSAFNAGGFFDPNQPANEDLPRRDGSPYLPDGIAPEPYLDAVYSAYRRFPELRRRWREVVKASLDAVRETLGRRG